MTNFIDTIDKTNFINGEWHIHTDFTDGKNSIEQYCHLASQLGLNVLAFTEHVRKELTYNFDEFVEQINYAKEKYPKLQIYSGCEVKILPDGCLDCSETVLNMSDYILVAFHAFPYDKKTYINAVTSVFQNYKINAWAHPGLFFKKYGGDLNLEELEELFNLMSSQNIYLEVNLRYSLPSKKWLQQFLKISGSQKVVLGGDIHSLKDMEKSYQLKSEIKKIHNSKTKNIEENLFRAVLRNYNKRGKYEFE